MKQGRASRDVRAAKHAQPSTRAANPSAVADLGTMRGDHTNAGGNIGFKKEPLFTGAGFMGPRPPAQGLGPGGGRTVHKTGSQGRHK